jgi:hypothetical protein
MELSDGHLPVTFELAVARGKAVVGTVVVDAAPQNLLGYMAGRVVIAVLRESCF